MWLGGKWVDWICFLKANVTLTMNLTILFNKTTMTAICERMPAFLRPRILGFARIVKSSLAVELVLSEADLRVFNF